MSYKLISTSVLFKRRVELLHVAQVAPAPWRFLNKSIKTRLLDEQGMLRSNLCNSVLIMTAKLTDVRRKLCGKV